MIKKYLITIETPWPDTIQEEIEIDCDGKTATQIKEEINEETRNIIGNNFPSSWEEIE